MNPYPATAKIFDSELRGTKARKVISLISDFRSDLLSKNCLELGCAYGLMTELFAGAFATVVGVDVDEPALSVARARSRLDNVEYLLSDARRLPFSSAAFDLVICAQVYEHIGDTGGLTREIRRVLKRGGLCYFSGPNWWWPMEDHYGLPFVHWLPRSVAGRYLRLLGRGRRYSEYPQTAAALRRDMAGFLIYDCTELILSDPKQYLGAGFRLVKRLPLPLAKLAAPLVPNFNWILEKVAE